MKIRNDSSRAATLQFSARIALLGTFSIFGGMFGIWQVLIANLSQELSLTPGDLGAVISCGLVVSLPAMAIGGRLVDRWGSQKVIVGTGIVMGTLFGGLAVVQHYSTLVVLLACFFAMTGLYDVGINAAAMWFEQTYRRQILTYCHAAFSGSAAGAALITGMFVITGLSFRYVYVGGAIGIVSVIITVQVSQSLRASRSQNRTSAPQARFFWRSTTILLLASIAALANMVQGSLENWTAVYLRSTLALPALMGASGIAVFHTAMLLGRLGTGLVVQRLGRRKVLQWSGVVVATGMILTLSTNVPLVILSGMLMVGATLAVIAPIAFSLAGDTVGGQSGQVSSVMTIISYGGLLLGPVLIGSLAEMIGLRVSLGTVVSVGFLVTLLSSRLRKN